MYEDCTEIINECSKYDYNHSTMCLCYPCDSTYLYKNNLIHRFYEWIGFNQFLQVFNLSLDTTMLLQWFYKNKVWFQHEFLVLW